MEASEVSNMVERISVETQKLTMSWDVIALLIGIEKFDSDWPSVMHREFAALDAFRINDPQPSYKVYTGVIDALAGNVDSVKVQAMTNFKCLYDWYKTELDIPGLG